MIIALWTVQGLLAVLFLMAGGMKLFAYERYMKMAEQRHPDRELGLSKGLVTFIGASEVAGALGVILPEGTGIATVLTPLAAVGLAVIMVLATRFHMRRQEPVSVTIGLFVLCATVVMGRGLSQ